MVTPNLKDCKDDKQKLVDQFINEAQVNNQDILNKEEEIKLLLEQAKNENDNKKKIIIHSKVQVLRESIKDDPKVDITENIDEITREINNFDCNKVQNLLNITQGGKRRTRKRGKKARRSKKNNKKRKGKKSKRTRKHK